jgi:RNA polymerase sigma-70 factor, ECF subfamily
MDVDDDDAVVARVLGGDRDAFGVLVERHQGPVWAVAAAALRDRDGTTDLVQQVFVEAYFALKRYEAGRGFGTWVRGIARNQVREHLRKAQRRDRFLKHYGAALDEAWREPEEADARDEALGEAQRRCREGLGTSSAELLRLRYEESLAHEEIGRRVGKSMEAVKQMLYRLHLSLKDCIQKRLAGA